MVIVKQADVQNTTCAACNKRAVVVLVLKIKNWSRRTPLCVRCQAMTAKKLSPASTSKTDLQRVWNMAVEMSGENSYSDYDETYGGRLGVSEPFRSAINSVRKAFRLRGKDVK